MPTEDSDNFPPPGWRMETRVTNGRTIKSYINDKAKLKLYSKVAVLRHLNIGSLDSGSPQSIVTQAKQSPPQEQSQLVVEVESPDWLPKGWSVEARTRMSGSMKGKKYKIYLDPSTGSKFYSKPEVMRHLETSNSNAGVSNRKTKPDISCNMNDCPTSPVSIPSDSVPHKLDQASQETLFSGKKKFKIERMVDKDLPAGWIKEIRIKKSGNRERKDALYYNPASEYVFRSKLEVLRYLETGEISRHAFKRKDKADTKLELTEGISPPTSSAKRRKTPRNAAKKHFFVGEGKLLGKSSAAGGSKTRCSQEPSAIVTPPISEEGFSIEEMTADSPIEDDVDVDSLIFSITMDVHKQERDILECFPPDILKEASAVDCLAGPSHNGTQETENEINPAALDQLGSCGTDEIQTGLDHMDSEPVSAGNFPVGKIPVDLKGEQVEEKKSRPKKRKDVTVPSRSSKRLSGVEVEPVTNTLPTIPIERALRRKSCVETETKSSVKLNSDSLHLEENAKQVDVSHEKNSAPPAHVQADSLPPAHVQADSLPPAHVQADSLPPPHAQVDSLPPANVQAGSVPPIFVQEEPTPLVCAQADAPKGEGFLTSSRSLVEDSAALEQQRPSGGLNGTRENVPLESELMPSFWSDPCLEFAFRTLTGAMPVDDNLDGINEYLQHQRRTAANNITAVNNINSSLTDIGMDNTAANGVSTAFVSKNNADCLQQSQMKPVSASPVDIDRSSRGPQI